MAHRPPTSRATVRGALKAAAEKFTHQPCPRCGAPETVVSGAWMRGVRQKAGLTLREMARRLDVSAVYLCDIELGRRNALPRFVTAYEKLTALLLTPPIQALTLRGRHSRTDHDWRGINQVEQKAGHVDGSVLRRLIAQAFAPPATSEDK